MGANTAENTNLRLKAVLDILAESVWSGATLNAGEVLAEAIVRVPFNDHEAELLSGGIPRGHKTLTSASAKLVKAGWLVKGRSVGPFRRTACVRLWPSRTLRHLEQRSTPALRYRPTSPFRRPRL